MSPQKPPYRVPSMAEIAAIEPNGYIAASTFSGAGGSTLGYKMAGFRVVWANEFVAAARETYAANFPETVVDARDVREVQPKDVLSAAGLAEGELDVFDGSPPCASFSTAGKREKAWGQVKKYSDTEQRTDDLFFEYARLVRGIQPRVFVAENVAGLARGTAVGYAKLILRELESCGYRVSARILDAQWLGVPQSRTRLIFVGVRNDLGIDPVHPKPFAYRYSIRDAIPWIASVRGGNKAPFDSKGKVFSVDKPSPAVLGGDTLGLAPYQFEVEDAAWKGMSPCLGEEWDKLRQGEASEKYFSLVRADAERPCPVVTVAASRAAGVAHPTERRKFSIAELRRICSFPDDFVLTGSYAQQWERCGRAVPPLMMRAVAETVRDEILAKVKARAR